MATVLLALHIMIAAALVGVVLLQKAEAGGLVGGGGGGGFLTGRGTANLLTRTTAILAGLFFMTSLLLTVVAQHGQGTRVFDAGDATKPAASSPAGSTDTSAPTAPATIPGGRGGLLDQLEKSGRSPLPTLPNTR